MNHEMNQVRPGHLSDGSAYRDTAYPDQSDFYDPAGLPVRRSASSPSSPSLTLVLPPNRRRTT
jgi:hypothetical protein